MEGEHQPPFTLEAPESPEGLKPQLEVRPWRDEIVETLGHGPRSMYVEMCWLPVLGPTATWLYRRLGSWVEYNPDGLVIDLVDLAVSMGLGEGLGRNSLMARALQRLTRFDAARWQADALQVRQALAPLPERHARRLSYTAYRFHEEVTRRPKPQTGVQS